MSDKSPGGSFQAQTVMKAQLLQCLRNEEITTMQRRTSYRNVNEDAKEKQ